MNYITQKNNLENIFKYLRNKNLAILPKKNSFLGFTRLVNLVTKINLNWMQIFGYSVVISEQIIEIPLVFRNLRDKDKTILDFGGVESFLPLQLSLLGYKVTVLDQRNYPFYNPNLKVLCCDLFDQGIKINKKFDAIISVSTIEHLGLGRYGDRVIIDEADKHGVEILWSLLKDGGRFMASVPAGKPVIQRGYRVYDEEKISDVFPNASSVLWFKKKGREGVWSQVKGEAVNDLIYSEPYSQMPVEAIAFVISDKK